MPIQYVKFADDKTAIDFLNNEQEGFIKINVPDDWYEAFCLRTQDFIYDKRDGQDIIDIKSGVLAATWIEFNTVKPLIDEVKQENEKLQTALDESDSKYQGLLNKVQEAEQTGEELGSLVVELQSQIETLKGGNK